MTIEQLLLKSPQQLEEYCSALSDKDKQDLYEQLMDEAQGKNLTELKQLDKLNTAIEKTAGKKLLEYLDSDDNPYNKIAIIDFFGRLGQRLIHMMYCKNLKELNELDELLPEMCRRLRPSEARVFAEKEFRFSNFLRENIDILKLAEEAKNGSIEKRKKATIELVKPFFLQPELNYGGDMFILELILDCIGAFGKEVDDLACDIYILVELIEESAETGSEEKELMDQRDKVVKQLYKLRSKQFWRLKLQREKPIGSKSLLLVAKKKFAQT